VKHVQEEGLVEAFITNGGIVLGSLAFNLGRLKKNLENQENLLIKYLEEKK
jgi:hypothetical protein